MEPSPIVIDNGSGTIKAGWAGDDLPQTITPSLVGRPRVSQQSNGKKKAYCGHETTANRSSLNVQRPILQGRIENWDDMEDLWHYIFDKELRVAPEEVALFFLPP